MAGGLIVLLAFLLYDARNKASQAEAQIASLQAEKTRLESESAGLQSKLLSEADLKRLQEDQREAIKLRGEVANLKNAVSDAEKARAAAQKAAASATKPAAKAPATKPEDNPYLRVFQRKATAVIPQGHGIILGDFEATPGKRTFAIAIPQIEPTNPNSILVETKWIEFGEEAQAKLASFVPHGGQSLNLTPEQIAQFMAAAKDTPGVDFLAGPRISTASGMAGSVSVTESRDTPAGPITVGPEVNLTSTLLADGSIHMAIEAKLNQAQNLDAPKPGQ